MRRRACPILLTLLLGLCACDGAPPAAGHHRRSDAGDAAASETASDTAADAQAPLPRRAAPDDPLALSELRLDHGLMRDAWGRTVILRGVNARVNGLFDVTFDDGRTPVQSIPEFDETDFERMRKWGFNVLRLPVNWSGIEPARDQRDDAYLQRLDQMVDWCGRYQVYCLIDFHQDAYSKEIGEDGVPLWAIIPPPDQLLEGPLEGDELQRRRTSTQVREAFVSFWKNKQGIQDAFIDTFATVAARYRGRHAVVGFEVLNEPAFMAQLQQLWDFYHAAIDASRSRGVEKPLFVEPNSLRNLFNQARMPGEPFEDPQLVYAPHIYTTVFSSPMDNFGSGDIDDLSPSVDAAREEGRHLSTTDAGLFVGEYGIDPRAENSALFIRDELDLQERTLAIGSTFWLWEELGSGRWGITKDDDGAPRPARLQALSRPYPRRVAGVLQSLHYDVEQATLRFSYLAADADGIVTAPNVVYLAPTRHLDPDALTITCDGQPLEAGEVRFDGVSGTVSFVCPLPPSPGETPIDVVVE